MSVESLTPAVTLQIAAPHVALVTIDRPSARNAVNADVTNGLVLAIERTEAANDIWVVVLTGAADQAFCAGADLKQVAAGRLPGLITPDGGFAGFVYAQRTRPWIAAVNGVAVAGGCEIALACDMIVAVKSARFGLPEVKRGLIAAAGGLFRLPRALPRQLAMELITTGGTIDAERASAFGVVNRVCGPGEAVNEALRLAATICENAPLAVRESLAVARRAFDLETQQLRELSDTAQERIMRTADFNEGPRAFIEKRPPHWQGR
jgi:enoyl-CoA hydratase/carnithine racemase